MTAPFNVSATDPGSRARRGSLLTAHGRIETPVFMDVGTRATVTDCTPADLASVGAQVVLGNTYHLMLRPGVEAFRRLGGIHKFMGWSGPVLTDSGGYQIFSLPGSRTVTEKGARFKGYTDQQMHMLSPERAIEVQTAIGSDIMMVLDECINSMSDDTLKRERIPIQPDGSIVVPYIGPFPAADKTVVQLRQDLEKALQKYIHSPAINVEPVRVNTALEDLRQAVNPQVGLGIPPEWMQMLMRGQPSSNQSYQYGFAPGYIVPNTYPSPPQPARLSDSPINSQPQSTEIPR